MKRRYSFRRSVGMQPSMAEKVLALAERNGWSFESAVRRLVAESLRLRESSAPSDSPKPAEVNREDPRP